MDNGIQIMNDKFSLLSFRDRVFVSDLNGTLLNAEGAILDKSADRLNRLFSNGLKFTIATARNYDSASKILKRLNLNLPAILFNGTCLIEFPSGINRTEPIGVDRMIIDEILFASKNFNVTPLLYGFNERHSLFYREPVNLGT